MKTNDGTSSFATKTCAVVFAIFCCVYIYLYQSDILAVAQHVASGGKTRYSPVWGTIILIIVLKLIQSVIQSFLKLWNGLFWLTYFPSLLILAVITNIPSSMQPVFSFGVWTWLFPLLIILWAIIVITLRRSPANNPRFESNTGILSKTMGANLTGILLMMLGVCLLGNHDRIFHNQMHVEALVSRNDFSEAATVANDYPEDNINISLLGTYSLARQGLIADSLFSLKMNNLHSINPSRSYFSFVIVDKNKMLEDYKRNPDWQLMELLVNKRLNLFYSKLLDYYGLKEFLNNKSSSSSTGNSKSDKAEKHERDSIINSICSKLPKHYREALAVYSTINRHCIADSVDVKNFIDFKKSSPQRRQKIYGKTYWNFFYE